MMRLALVDAANNCGNEGATAILTLRSGRSFEGKLERPSLEGQPVTVRLTHGGWIAIDPEEIVAVESRPRGAS